MEENASPGSNSGPASGSSGETAGPLSGDDKPSFPGLLPAPVLASTPVVRRVGWLAAAGASLLGLLAAAVLVGWLIRGDGSDPEALPEALAPVPSVSWLVNSGDEPVVAVAEAVAPSVVLVIVPGVSQGSGIVFDNEGRIVTNAHVVAEPGEVQILLPSGRLVKGTVVGADVRRDVAVVQLDVTDESVKVATFAPSEQIRVGQLAVAVGSPFELNQTVTAGIVSAVGRVVPAYGCQVGGTRSAECADVSMIQTDAPISPGNSGGPLADRTGRVIGMNTSIRTERFLTANAGVGFAIPSDTVLLVAHRLISGEPVATAFLGISGVTPRDGRAGALIESVVEGSPADRAGLKIRDLIVRSDGRPIPDMRALRADIQLRLPGTEVVLEYLRSDQTGTAILNLASLDEELSDED
ncbi:MAG: trypsin-like peptidase domain-containing protein [Actinomycetota bacterium]|nr:trypsin-like peptidase domain-containing protein [Actinomycetota bacterium]